MSIFWGAKLGQGSWPIETQVLLIARRYECPSALKSHIGKSTQLLRLIAKNDLFVCFGWFFGTNLPVKKSKAVDADAIR